jgi:hypothetical protein
MRAVLLGRPITEAIEIGKLVAIEQIGLVFYRRVFSGIEEVEQPGEMCRALVIKAQK